MQTILLQGDCSEDLKQAAQLLRSGETVAFPTDTVYGLGANAQSDTAIEKIYEKNKKIVKQIITHNSFFIKSPTFRCIIA